MTIFIEHSNFIDKFLWFKVKKRKYKDDWKYIAIDSYWSEYWNGAHSFDDELIQL